MQNEEEASARRNLLNRIRRVEGQLRGVQKMIETGDDCSMVAQQLAAARKALDGAFFELIACAIRGEGVGLAGASASQRSSTIANLLVKYG